MHSGSLPQPHACKSSRKSPLTRPHNSAWLARVASARRHTQQSVAIRYWFIAEQGPLSDDAQLIEIALMITYCFAKARAFTSKVRFFQVRNF